MRAFSVAVVESVNGSVDGVKFAVWREIPL